MPRLLSEDKTCEVDCVHEADQQHAKPELPDKSCKLITKSQRSNRPQMFYFAPISTSSFRRRFPYHLTSRERQITPINRCRNRGQGMPQAPSKLPQSKEAYIPPQQLMLLRWSCVLVASVVDERML